jgi:hypothetical protein
VNKQKIKTSELLKTLIILCGQIAPTFLASDIPVGWDAVLEKRPSLKKDVKKDAMDTNDIFGGNNSRELWNEINSAKTKKKFRWALYSVCCKLQEMETRLRAMTKANNLKKGWD